MTRRSATFAAVMPLLGAAGPVSAAWLVLCDEPLEHGRRYGEPGGRQQTLLISDSPLERCEAVRIDAAAGEANWTSLVPGGVAGNSAGGLGLLGAEVDGRFRVSEVIPADTSSSAAPPLRPPVRMDISLLPMLDVTSFGVEGRAAPEVTPHGIGLSCRSGSQAAGLLLSIRGYRLPAGARMAAAIRYRADTNFQVGFSGPDDLQRESPNLIGTLPARHTEGDSSLFLPVTGDNGVHALSILCPASDAELKMRDLKLQPGAQPRLRATWIWKQERWSNAPDRLVRDLTGAGMATAFVAIPLAGEPLRVAKPAALVRFINKAFAANIEVWAVDGDPAAITASGRKSFVARAEALAAFNAARESDSQLHGVQYDIEPYLMPGFDLAREPWLSAYVDTLRELRDTVQMPIEVAIPFWWHELTVDGQPILDTMARFVAGISVMNYRTDPEQLLANGIPYLEWGQRSGRYVRIALESGPLADQTLRSFRPNDSGRLWQLAIGDRTALILWDKPAPNPNGPAFAHTHDVAVPASRTTFFGQRERLDSLLPELSRQWIIWPSYAGLALHEYLAD